MMRILTLTLTLTILFASCMSTEEKKQKAEEEGNALVAIKSKLLKGAGDALKSDGKEAAESASEGVGEVIKGVNSGFDKSLSGVDIAIDSATSEYFEIGRSHKDFSGEEDEKKVSVYLIAKNNFEGKVMLKAFDADGKEIGRSTQEIKIEKDEANYSDFTFDKRTPLLQATSFSLEVKK
ncbi:hypothetical protein [Marinigracilibium pacificum]|uniref:Lipoprotein n=1 Tax=Marinigracilibium pacificum TaxID=2729599 RepID=A0A848ITQ0_9BACT|nr:hypothetical protein [Marinigracilibium pacificum]NMM47126.1 hypothetical protein [Marinigracilibium pacificum]